MVTVKHYDQCPIDSFSPSLYNVDMLIVALFMLLVFHSAAQAWDTIYQCPDGTFTNRAELRCERYIPSSQTDERAVQLPAVQPRLPLAASSLSAADSSTLRDDSVNQCTVYRQWLELDHQTQRGTAFATVTDLRRWTTLSRMYRSLGTPSCDFSARAVTRDGTETR